MRALFSEEPREFGLEKLEGIFEHRRRDVVYRG